MGYIALNVQSVGIPVFLVLHVDICLYVLQILNYEQLLRMHAFY